MLFDDVLGLVLTIRRLPYLIFAMLRPEKFSAASAGFQAIVFFLIVLAVTKPLGSYMARVFAGERAWASSFFVPVERNCGLAPAGFTKSQR